jgi:dTDP-4-dehydrorhamnose 3,5-epimerase
MGIAVKITPTRLDGVVVIETDPFQDKRGAFSRMFCARELEGIIGPRSIVQINRSRTNAVGAVRGLHYQQSPNAEMKLVSCLRGSVWDVAVDLRRGSATFLQWHREELSPGNGRTLVIPEGCAHGFQVMEAGSELLYLHTAFYNPASEGGVQPTDPLLGILWQLPIVDLSDRDKNHPLLSSAFTGIAV